MRQNYRLAQRHIRHGTALPVERYSLIALGIDRSIALGKLFFAQHHLGAQQAGQGREDCGKVFQLNVSGPGHRASRDCASEGVRQAHSIPPLGRVRESCITVLLSHTSPIGADPAHDAETIHSVGFRALHGAKKRRHIG